MFSRAMNLGNRGDPPTRPSTAATAVPLGAGKGAAVASQPPPRLQRTVSGAGVGQNADPAKAQAELNRLRQIAQLPGMAGGLKDGGERLKARINQLEKQVSGHACLTAAELEAPSACLPPPSEQEGPQASTPPLPEQSLALQLAAAASMPLPSSASPPHKLEPGPQPMRLDLPAPPAAGAERHTPDPPASRGPAHVAGGNAASSPDCHVLPPPRQQTQAHMPLQQSAAEQWRKPPPPPPPEQQQWPAMPHLVAQRPHVPQVQATAGLAHNPPAAVAPYPTAIVPQLWAAPRGPTAMAPPSQQPVVSLQAPPAASHVPPPQPLQHNLDTAAPPPQKGDSSSSASQGPSAVDALRLEQEKYKVLKFKIHHYAGMLGKPEAAAVSKAFGNKVLDVSDSLSEAWGGRGDVLAPHMCMLAKPEGAGQLPALGICLTCPSTPAL
jgi:hypothetical protein